MIQRLPKSYKSVDVIRTYTAATSDTIHEKNGGKVTYGIARLADGDIGKVVHFHDGIAGLVNVRQILLEGGRLVDPCDIACIHCVTKINKGSDNMKVMCCAPCVRLSPNP